MFSRTTTELSISLENARASPPRTMGFRDIHQTGHSAFYAVHHGDRIDVTSLLEYGQVDGALAVDPYHAGLDLRGITRFSHVSHHHRGCAYRLERKLVDFCYGRQLTVGIETVVEWANDYVPGWQNQVGVVDGPHHIHHAQFMGL